MNDHKSKFGEDFVDNKKALNQVSIIRSKGLKNKVAGYITRFIKKQIREEKFKQDRSTYDSSKSDEQGTSLDVTESEEVSETLEEITLTNEEVETIVPSTKSDEESSGVSASYTMGSTTIGFVANSTENVAGTAASDDSYREIAVSFAF